MSERKGTISVATSDIFPIIKKWLYSEHDIFLRELVANATDAITKRSTIARTKNEEIPSGKIQVVVDKDSKTIKISDNGIGMTETEVEKYIAQLAFSGAEEFVKKIKDQGETTKDEIIGKFGLGFFSSFMVAAKVEVDSLSMEKNSVATKWSCEGDTEYKFSNSDRTTVGTTITLYVNEDGEEFLSGHKVSSTLKKFCDFMPYPIAVVDLHQIASDKKYNEKLKAEGKEDKDLFPVEEETIINETRPLWKKDPKDIKDEEYKEFFRKLYPMDPEPLFWLHLNVDHPFTLEGILFFPKINPTRPFNDSNIKLYCKQVFVSDNVKNIIPEFLSLLKGTVDSPDIPLNVSRSSLQGDPNIKKISNYIVKKVAEALKKLFKNDRTKFEAIWDDISLFVKYGAISDSKFDEQMREHILFKIEDKNYKTIQEYADSIPESFKEKLKDTVIYFEKGTSDWSLRKQLKDEGIVVVETDDHIDPHFLQHVETKPINDKKIRFASIDSEFGKILSSENSTEEDIMIKDLFSKVLIDSKNTTTENTKEIEIEKLKNANAPAYFKVDEQMKRFRNMAKSMGQEAVFPVKKTLVINPNNLLIQNALKISQRNNREELVRKICHHVEDLATIASTGLKNEDKESFVVRSQELIQELTSLALD